jgi:phage baseplate assembly protein W
MASVFGFNPPFFGGPQNILSRQEDDKLIKNDLLQLLLTSPGERIYSPNFGVNLKNRVFDPLEETTIDSLKQEIYTKVTLYEPRITIKTLDVKTDDQGNLISVRIVGSIKSDPASIITFDYEPEVLRNGGSN